VSGTKPNSCCGIGKGRIKLPEHTIVAAYGEGGNFSRDLALLSCVAELRRGRDYADFFDGLRPEEQAAWATELLQRMNASNSNAPYISVLDTGINRGHPLLDQLISAGASQDDAMVGGLSGRCGEKNRQIQKLRLWFLWFAFRCWTRRLNGWAALGVPAANICYFSAQKDRWRTSWKQFVRFSLYLLLAQGLFMAFADLSYHRRHADPDSIGGRQFFSNVYFQSYGIGGAFWENGPNTHILNQAVIAYFRDHPEQDLHFGQHYSDTEYEVLFGQYRNHPEALARRMFALPQRYYFWTFFGMASLKDHTINDRMFLLSALEQLERYPLLRKRLIETNLKGYIFGPPISFSGNFDTIGSPTTLETEPPLLYFCSNMVAAKFDPKLLARKFWLQSELDLNDAPEYCAQHIVPLWREAYLTLMPIAASLMLLGSLCCK
jgi:hypothetical protein